MIFHRRLGEVFPKRGRSIVRQPYNIRLKVFIAK
jgi:hypothetical protein